MLVIAMPMLEMLVVMVGSGGGGNGNGNGGYVVDTNQLK